MGSAQHTDAPAPCLQRSPGRRGVNARGQTGDDDAAALCGLISKPAACFQAVGAGFPGADDRDGGLIIQLRQLSPDIDYRRRGKDIPEPPGIIRVLHGDRAQVQSPALCQNLLHPGQIPVFQNGGVPGRDAPDLGKVPGGREKRCLRVAVMAQKRGFRGSADPGLGGEPDPVFDGCHCHSPRFLF